MGKINLHIAQASQHFTQKDTDTIRKAAKEADEYISANFDFDYEIDVIITAPSLLMGPIPEDGISGRTFSSRLIALTIDKQVAEITEDTVFETLCHELSHSLRWEKVPEYSKTLFDGIIMEGLAIVLEEKAMSDTGRQQKQFFLKEMQGTGQTTIDDAISQLHSKFDDEQYDYETIFYTGNDTLPRWTGYRLGYYFVKNHLEKSDSTIYQATFASYSDFSS